MKSSIWYRAFYLQSIVFMLIPLSFGWHRPQHLAALFKPLFFIADLAFSVLGRGFTKEVTLGVISLTIRKTNTEGGEPGQNKGAHSLGVME